MAKIALLIGVSEYEPGFNSLPAAVKDVEAMHRVLVHPDMGGFAEADITVLKNPQKYEMENAIYELFANRKKDDLLLLYFSGHGITDQLGQFYLATRSTRKDQAKQLIDVTAVAASLLHQKMSNSRCDQQIVILDCCFSGAFAKGMNAKSDGTVNIQTQLGGKGRAVLASSTSTQYSFEHKDSGFSIYTNYLVEGIQQGKADGDSDGWISVDELHEYASDRVKTYCLDCDIDPPMTPEIYAVKEGYKIHIAKAPIVDVKLRYRQEAKNRLIQGKFSRPAVRILKTRQVELGLSEDEAEAILKELVRPYREYKEVLIEALDEEGYPLSEAAQNDLKDYQQILGLRDEDIAPIEEEVRVIASQQKATTSPSVSNSEPLQIPPTPLEKGDFECVPSELGDCSVNENTEELLVEKGSIAPVPPFLRGARGDRTFEFEVATLSIVKKGWFGEKVTYEINRSRKRAEFFAEDLGNGITLEMIAIPGGTFPMGSPENEPERNEYEGPQHTVTIQPFFMGKFTVTQAQWRVVASFPKVKIDLDPDPSNFKGANRPVECVSWYDAVEFCERLSRKTGQRYQLPSEAEWEYACRAGTDTPFHFGETISTELANYNGNYTYASSPKGTYREQTTDVGSFSANAFGLYDMHGNVWEWCADQWHDSYDGAPIDGSEWATDNDNASRLLRGGSWDFNPRDCRCAYRFRRTPGYGSDFIGFRVVISPV
ncbi:MAG TPA: sulfatase-modifying factor protein, partial [Cyanobacteria bacterium UBA8543]|nr:sulfatase-modifying factor protein [Cyanobacteria bacterium UBA8543]